MQFIAIITTGITSLFIPWTFFWRNLGRLLTIDIAVVVLPILIFVAAIIQAPKFIPYFYGIYKGTEEKIFFFKSISRKEKQTAEDGIIDS